MGCMIHKLYQQRPDLFVIFQTDEWNRASAQRIQNNFQEIANCLSYMLGMKKPLCEVQIVKENSKRFKGRYVHETHILQIEHKIAVDKLKPPYYDKGVPISSPLSHKDAFEVFIHEFRHAIQEYEKEFVHPYTPSERTKLLWYNDEHMQNTEVNMYFCGGDKYADALHCIQPVERDAYMFAATLCQQFNDVMHKAYPDDLAFIMHEDYSNFTENVEKATILFNTQMPFEAIDDVLRSLNGDIPLNTLNTIMLEKVLETQSKTKMRQISERSSQAIKQISDRFLDGVAKAFPFDLRPVHEQKQSQDISTDWNVRTDRDERGRE